MLEDMEIISSYGVEQACEDGEMVRVDNIFGLTISPGIWAMTNGVWAAIEKKTDARTMPQRVVPFLNDAFMVVIAKLQRKPDEYLITKGLEGNVTGRDVWIAKNESGGWTIMFPDEY